MPALIKMAMSEEKIKLQTRVISSLVCFVRGLLHNDDEDDEETDRVKGGQKLIGPYSQDLLQMLA